MAKYETLSVDEFNRIRGAVPGRKLAVDRATEVHSCKTYTATFKFPPSLNHYWRNFRGRMVISSEGRKYRANLAAYAPVIGKFTGRLEVTLRLTMPDKRRRDIDNLSKVLLDSLTHAGLWEDDSQIDILHIVRGRVEKPGCVDIQVREIAITQKARNQ